MLFSPPPADRAAELALRRKRGGHLISKARFLAAQLEAYLTDDLWLRNARHANAAAARLAAGLERALGVAPAEPVEANEIFIALGKGGDDGAARRRVSLSRLAGHRRGRRAPGGELVDD